MTSALPPSILFTGEKWEDSHGLNTDSESSDALLRCWVLFKKILGLHGLAQSCEKGPIYRRGGGQSILRPLRYMTGSLPDANTFAQLYRAGPRTPA